MFFTVKDELQGAKLFTVENNQEIKWWLGHHAPQSATTNW